MRQATKERQTKETEIRLTLNLDGTGKSKISTGIPFFDHMLEQISRHGGLDLELEAIGDLEVDGHHTIEDTGILLGQALREAVGEKIGLTRYGHSYVPLDESLARVVLDLSGRPYLYFDAHFPFEYIGKYPSEMTKEFFQAVANNALLTLHIELLHGENTHHQTEAIFKAFGRALKMAVQVDPTVEGIPSTKGTL